MTSDYARRSVNPKILTLSVSVSAASPYAIHVDWGDGRDSLKSVLTTGEFTLEHTYLYSGIYKVVARAVDIDGSRAVLHLVAVSKGTLTAPNSDTTSKEAKTVVLWVPMVVFIVFMVLTFWLGVRYERRRSE